MEKINPLLSGVSRALKQASDGSRTEAGQNSERQSDAGQQGPDRVDAINQLFAEFELAYHNQYHKAYGDPERLALTKKYWLQVLSDFSPAQIVAAGRRLVRSQEFLPSLSVVVKACAEGHSLFGLPAPRDAYIEACRAPAPKAAQEWSHPAVYYAGKSADWHFLSAEAEDRAYPVFAHYYREYCQRVMRGENLERPAAPALEEAPTRPLTDEQREKEMAALRKQLGI